MKQGIHPDYVETTIVCSCGNKFKTNSTAGGELHLELCNQCHPFFTGQQKFVDTGGRVQRFSDKFGSAASAVLEKDAAEKESRRKATEEGALKVKQEREAKAAEKAARAAKYEVKEARDAAKAEVVEAAAVAEKPAAEVDAPVDEPVVDQSAE